MLKVVLISILVFSVTGCANSNLQEKLQGSGPTTIELYRGSVDSAEPLKESVDIDRLRSTVGEVVRYEDYTREAGNEINQLFPRLPNPRILIYVFPHLASSDNAPIPGYTTAVNLYDKDEYALPHEIASYRAVREDTGL